MAAYGGVGVLYAIVAKLANATAAPTWHLQRPSRTPDAEPVEVFNHAALTVLKTPNPFYTLFDLFETIQQHLDLTGEAIIVIARNKAFKIPLELWPCRPDRIEPVPDKDTFIRGWVYYGPNGEKIPLEPDEVIQIKLPNPLDPYRGMGPVQSILTQLDAVRYTAEWNLNFFRNSAEPGGIIEAPRKLSTNEFDELRSRWGEQHQGVARAHRVAILEGMKWVERKYTQKDMQFVELMQASEEQIRTAFAFPRPMLGTVDDTNRANMDAAQTIFDRACVVPRLDRIRNALNHKFLPLFGDTSKGLEFVYDSPVMEDSTTENAERNSKASAFKTLIDAGVSSKDAAEVCELPPMTMAPKPKPIIPKDNPDVEPDVEAVRAFLRLSRARTSHLRRSPRDADEEDLPSIEHVQASWEAILAGLLVSFESVLSSWFNTLTEQVRALAGYSPGFSDLRVSTLAGVEVLTSAMERAAREAADGVVAEAAAQGVALPPGIVHPDLMRTRAEVIISHLGQDYSLSAGREALRLGGDADRLREHLDSLTAARPELYLGNALTQGQHAGRLATFGQAADGPIPAYYASEVLDTNTCKYCREMHGRWLGNDLSAEVSAMYPTGGYISCQGRQRCRGMVVCVWRPGADRSKWIEKEPI
jgi:HK97 family phage portal protein